MSQRRFGRLTRSCERLGQRVVVVSLAFLLISCARSDAVAPPQEFDTARAQRMFSAGYQDVSAVFIREVPPSQLAIAGLGELSTIDPSIDVARGGDEVHLLVDGDIAARIDAPRDTDNEGWARVTSLVIWEGRARSETLRAAKTETIYETVFDGMISQLDTYSRYSGREEARENRAGRDGFGGIGVRIQVIAEGVKIVSVMEETPAQRSGMQDGDVVVTIDGVPAAGMSQREVVRRLRGPLDSRVALEVQRRDVSELVDISVVRAHIVPQTVSYRANGGSAYIKVSGFNQSTTRTLRQKLREVEGQRENGRLDGIILDLRDNPGGLLDQAVSVADLFVDDGRIVSTHGRHPDSHQYFDARSDEVLDTVPMVVLVNGNSASASEIVAAALQDSGRAVVVGSNSFGKGTVQTVLRLPNEGELTLTWARFHAPSGYALHHRGILPDVCTSNVDSREQALRDLDSGSLLISSTLQQAAISAEDEAALAALRLNCPLREDDNAFDVEIAQRLLGDPDLFARTKGSQVDTARSGDQLSLKLN